MPTTPVTPFDHPAGADHVTDPQGRAHAGRLAGDGADGDAAGGGGREVAPEQRFPALAGLATALAADQVLADLDPLPRSGDVPDQRETETEAAVERLVEQWPLEALCAAIRQLPAVFRTRVVLGRALVRRAVREAQESPVRWHPLLDALAETNCWPDDPRTETLGSQVSALAAWVDEPGRTAEELAALTRFSARPVRAAVMRHASQWSPDLLRLVEQDPGLAPAFLENPHCGGVDALALLPLLPVVMRALGADMQRFLDRLIPALRASGRQDAVIARDLLTGIPSDGLLATYESGYRAARLAAIHSLLALPGLGARELIGLAHRVRQTPELLMRCVAHRAATPLVWHRVFWLGAMPDVGRLLAADPRASRDPAIRPMLARIRDRVVLDTLLASAEGTERARLEAAAAALPAAEAPPRPMEDERIRIFAALDAVERLGESSPEAPTAGMAADPLAPAVARQGARAGRRLSRARPTAAPGAPDGPTRES